MKEAGTDDTEISPDIFLACGGIYMILLVIILSVCG